MKLTENIVSTAVMSVANAPMSTQLCTFVTSTSPA